MDLSKATPSSRFEDHTAYSDAQRTADRIMTKLNPVYAIRNLREALIANGTIETPARTIRLGLPKPGSF